MTTHDLKDAVLYQAIFTGTQDKALYQNAIKALMRHIRTKCRAEYIGGYEVGDEKGGLHAHCYIIIETSKHFPADLLDVREGQFLYRLANRKDKEICIRIEPPKNRMHGGQMFARMNTPEKLADCIKWASYYLKPRSKDAVPGRETYFGSEFASNITKREAQRQKHRDALLKSSRPAPAAQAPIPAPAKEPMMTPAARYIAARYEAAVDLGLDVEALRLYLLAHGIKRTPAQVRHELDDVYGFYQYADTHQPKPVISVGEWDRAVCRLAVPPGLPVDQLAG
jgi:hypothetical protein